MSLIHIEVEIENSCFFTWKKQDGERQQGRSPPEAPPTDGLHPVDELFGTLLLQGHSGRGESNPDPRRRGRSHFRSLSQWLLGGLRNLRRTEERWGNRTTFHDKAGWFVEGEAALPLKINSSWDART